MSGLPQGSTLSTGRPYGEGEWNLKTDEIGDLQLVLPHTASGVAKLIFQLVAPDGAIIADAATVINNRQLAVTVVRGFESHRFSHLFGLRPLANAPAATATAGDTRV